MYCIRKEMDPCLSCTCHGEPIAALALLHFTSPWLHICITDFKHALIPLYTLTLTYCTPAAGRPIACHTLYISLLDSFSVPLVGL